jgi:hypothetical protein
MSSDPATSEAGASRSKSLAGSIFYVLPFYLLLLFYFTSQLKTRDSKD